ncbi:MAG TPA: hypothetical protein VHE30_28710 [Polyangiaceae bacterium]|nr:hypothetical protein [Polyangiaceae bacterium]
MRSTVSRLVASVFLTLSVATSVHAGTFGPDAPPRAAPVARHAPPSASYGTEDEVARYRAREAASPEAAKFRGGSVIVISASALAVILLVVLLIVLI